MNGAIEAVNKNINKIVEKMAKTYKDWNGKLHFALHAYCTAIRISIGATTFFLTYGMETLTYQD